MNLPRVGMRVSVRLATIPGKGVFMLMMFVMPMRMLVREGFVRVLVQVPFGQV